MGTSNNLPEVGVQLPAAVFRAPLMFRRKPLEYAQ